MKTLSVFLIQILFLQPLDKVDKGISHARLKAGQSNYAFHGTSVQRGQDKPISVKSLYEDYIMLTRNLNADEKSFLKS